MMYGWFRHFYQITREVSPISLVEMLRWLGCCGLRSMHSSSQMLLKGAGLEHESVIIGTLVRIHFISHRIPQLNGALWLGKSSGHCSDGRCWQQPVWQVMVPGHDAIMKVYCDIKHHAPYIIYHHLIII